MLPSDPFRKTCLALAIAHTLAIPTTQAATIIVNTTSDTVGAGPCTLREAIVSIQAPGVGSTGCTYSGLFGVNDTISFNSGLYDQSILLDLGTALTITENLTINGLGEKHLTIDGSANGSAGIFKIDGAVVHLNGLTISKGVAGRGGGIHAVNSSTVSLTNSTVSGNSAGTGGGIYAQSSSTVNVTNSTVSGNTGSRVGGINATSSHLNVSNSNVSGNSGDFGGGIGSRSSAFNLTNSTVSGNSADRGGGGIYVVGFGGAVNLNNSTVSGNSVSEYGGGIFVIRGTVNLKNTTVAGNTAATIGGGLDNTNSVVNLTNSSLSGNTAGTVGGGISVGANYYAVNGASVTLTNSTVSGNSAGTNGGGIYSIKSSKLSLFNSTVSGNSAMDLGGGIVSSESRTHLTNSTISGNRANDSGGGILFHGSNTSDFMTLWHSTIVNNTTGDDGGGISMIGGAVKFTNSIVSGNTAVDLGDEIGSLGATFTADRHNLFGDSSKSNAQAFSGFSPNPAGSDITATSNGTMPTTFASILQTRLQYNGGPTKTHALVVDGPAINAGNPFLCQANDQRGEMRSDGKCDIGSYEFVTDSCYAINTSTSKTVVFCL